ncbi:MAG TPA: PCYCGC motif-containing (lipo)protein [Anaerolineae bacterium]|nr:PCYCGC motif-containing (lipo)protein [Anaerolineae bacterium]
MIKLRFNIFNLVILAGLFLVLVGCTSYGAMQKLTPTPKVTQVKLAIAPKSDLPAFAQKTEARVQEAYRFAIANPEVLTKIPCYCGCGTMGHRHTLDCYIKEFRPNGSIEFDNHAAGCGICVDITQDTMRLMRQGQDLKAIRAYVDAQYSQFAAPTNTPPIE